MEEYKVKIISRKNKSALARVSALASDRKIAIKSLNYSPYSKSGHYQIELELLAQKGQVQGFINDTSRLNFIKSATIVENVENISA